MITLKDGTVLRNLEEQVLENKQQIALHWNVDRVLADFGIHVRGTLSSKAALDRVPTADLDYGDAYFIGTKEPYDVWIWTRPDENAGKEEPYWLNIGHIAIEGPEGPRGPEGPAGPQGERGITWFTGSSVDTSSLKDGDLWLYTGAPSDSGYIYKWSATNMKWTNIANIRGPQGIQGPTGPQGPRGEQGPQGIQGPRGDSGGFINIRGILTNSNQLPTPASISDLSAAYLVGTASPYDLYIQVGENSASAVWTNSGPFNVGTLVSANGEYVNMWDADTKVDKKYADANYVKVPAYGNKTGAIVRYSDGKTTGVNVAPAGKISVSDIVRYSSTGTLAANDPVKETDVSTKQYADNLAVTLYNMLQETVRKPVTIYLNLGSGGDATIAAGVLGISAQLTPAEITALKAGIANDAENMTPRVTALFNYMANNRYTIDYLALPVNGQIATNDNLYYLSGGIHRNGTTTLKIRSGFGSEQQEPQYLEIHKGNISRVRLIVHIPDDPDDESP